MSKGELSMISPYNEADYAIPDLPRIPERDYSITDFGAVGDGMLLNTAAIQQTIDTCEAAGGGRVVITPGIWRTGPLTLRSCVNLHVEQGGLVLFEPDYTLYPLIQSHFEGNVVVRCQAPLDGEGLHDVAITGSGIIDGGGQGWRPVKKSKMTEAAWSKLVDSGGCVHADGDMWWPSMEAMEGEHIFHSLLEQGISGIEAYEPAKAYLRPTLLSLRSSERVLLSGPTFQNSPAWCLHLYDCSQVTVAHTTVRNPWYSQNGDGLDLESCRHAWVEHCSFDVGDDAICLKSGKDEEGRKRGLPCEFITIRHCIVYHGHGGVVVGSEMSGGIRCVRVSDCTFIGTDIGLRFKSTRGRGGIVEDLVMERIWMSDIVYEAVSFHLFYAGKEGSEGYDEQVYPVTEETPIFRDITLKDIVCQGASTAVLMNGLPEQPLSGLRIIGLQARSDKGIVGRYVESLVLERIHLQTDKDQELHLHHCHNVRIDGAAYDEASIR